MLKRQVQSTSFPTGIISKLIEKSVTYKQKKIEMVKTLENIKGVGEGEATAGLLSFLTQRPILNALGKVIQVILILCL